MNDLNSPRSRILVFPCIFAMGSLAIILFAIVCTQQFVTLNKTYPYPMGFLKLFFLGTVGELIKYRLTRGTWHLDKIFQRAIVWGIFGLWFVCVFAGFSILVDGLVQKRLWPSGIGICPNWLWIAFSKGLWLNVVGMYGWGMMVSHDYFNHLIKSGWQDWSLNSFASSADARFLLAYIPKTFLFWIPAQTFNFSMPEEWRVFIAAILAIVLGFLLSVGRRSQST